MIRAIPTQGPTWCTRFRKSRYDLPRVVESVSSNGYVLFVLSETSWSFLEGMDVGTTTGPIVVVADTHLGLLAGKRFYMIRNDSRCDLVGLSGFMRWLERLETETMQTVIRGSWGTPLEIRKPAQLILLGDYLELWDASDAAVEVSSRGLWNRMERLTCKKVQVVGNHDFSLNQLASSNAVGFPQGESFIGVYSDTYPPKMANGPTWVRVGNVCYLFLHGHQFDWAFRHLGNAWTIISYLRDGAEAFRLWSWILVLGALLALIASPFSIVFQSLAVALLLAGALPRLIVTCARPAWNCLAQTRYEPGKALRGFLDWWKNTIEVNKCPDEELCVVYGHTHLMDIYDSTELKKHIGAELPRNLKLINIPSWVEDVREEYQKILRDVALYIDDAGAHLLGWDWKKEQPFYIPEDITKRIAGGTPIDEQTAQNLGEIGWPQKLLDKLKQPPSILAMNRRGL